MQILCPHCHSLHELDSPKVGQRFRCDGCNRLLAVDHAPEALDLSGVVTDPLPVRVQPESALSTSAPITSSIPDVNVHDRIRVMSTDKEYIIDEELNRGGMGKILRATDRSLMREVAIKVVLDSRDSDLCSRFLEEAQITAQLEHPNIVPIHEVGIDKEGRVFFTMKLVRGRSLEFVLDEIRDGSKRMRDNYSLQRLTQALVDVCNAVAFAHNRGVIHRDLKPANIMLGDFGEVQVMDWGLAKIREESATSQRSDRRTSNTARINRPPVSLTAEALRSPTRDGVVAGTPAYMPPEQARGMPDKIDERSDVYALGAILYEILTLHPPVEAATDTGIVNSVVDGEIESPRRRAPYQKIPKVLERIAMRALSYDPEHRYEDVMSFRQELIKFLDGLVVAEKEEDLLPTLVRLGRHYKWLGFLTGVGVSVLVVVVFNLIQDAQQRRAEAERLLTAQKEELAQRKARAPSFLAMAQSEIVDKNNFELALFYLDSAITHDPELAESYKLRAQIRYYRKEYKLALQDLERYLKLKPNDPDGKRLEEFCHRAMDTQNDLPGLSTP